ARPRRGPACAVPILVRYSWCRFRSQVLGPAPPPVAAGGVGVYHPARASSASARAVERWRWVGLRGVGAGEESDGDCKAAKKRSTAAHEGTSLAPWRKCSRNTR